MTSPITATCIPSTARWRISRLFLREAHRRGLRVITELVLNHTSDQHPWFQRARRAPPGSRWRNFYVWSDTPDKYKEAPHHLQGRGDLQLDVGPTWPKPITGIGSFRTSRI